MISNEQEAYYCLANTVMDFVKNRVFDKAFCKCEVYTNMVSTSCWLEHDGILDEKSIDWPDSQLLTDEAVYYLKDLLLQKNNHRIWGLIFTLYPDGKFEIEYDYDKPEDYEETDDTYE